MKCYICHNKDLTDILNLGEQPPPLEFVTKEFLKKNDRFQIDKKIESKLLITVAPDGYLKCIKN